MRSRTYSLGKVIAWILVLIVMSFCILVASNVIRLPKVGIDDPRLTAYSGYVSDAPGSAGSTFTGKMKDGLFTEEGELVYPDKSSYTGEFKDGLFSGEGTYKARDGWSYVGHWSEGLPDGKGVYKSTNGGYYEGLFDAGMAVIEVEK
jgi:hypothetical protein